MRRQVWALVAAASAVVASGASATAEAPWREGVVKVDVATATASAESACPSLLARLPEELIGDEPRLVTADSPFVQAWGDVPVILVCGAEQPTVPADQPLISMNGVMWSADMGHSTTTI